MGISNLTDEKPTQWQNEILEFLQVGDMEKEKEQEEFIYYDGKCSYCGKGKSIDKLKRQLLRRDWICDECYKKRILKRADAACLADQSLKMLSPMYGIYPWKRFKVRLKRRWFMSHEYPWDKYDVVYRKWITKYDWMYVRKKLPEGTAEAAIVSALIEQYLIIRETENEVRDFFTKSIGREDARQGDRDGTSEGQEDTEQGDGDRDDTSKEREEAGQGDRDNTSKEREDTEQGAHDAMRKGSSRGAGGESRQGEHNGLVVWCTIHYLCIVRDKNYAKQYEKRLSDAEKGQYAECVKQLGTPLTNNYVKMEEILEILGSGKGK